MGMMYADTQEKAAKFLVQVLNELGGKVHYNYFYNDEPERARLCKGMEIDEDEADWICPEAVMDVAAATMEEQGYVKLHFPEGEVLSDGEPAYEIEMTEAGKAMLAAGKFPKFRNLDL